MSRTQRIVVIVYCLLLAYCCLWVPWRIADVQANPQYLRIGYGWLWAGPTSDSRFLDQGVVGAPDLPLIALRIVAATAISGAAFLGAGLFKSKATLN